MQALVSQAVAQLRAGDGKQTESRSGDEDGGRVEEATPKEVGDFTSKVGEVGASIGGDGVGGGEGGGGGESTATTLAYPTFPNKDSTVPPSSLPSQIYNQILADYLTHQSNLHYAQSRADMSQALSYTSKAPQDHQNAVNRLLVNAVQEQVNVAGGGTSVANSNTGKGG